MYAYTLVLSCSSLITSYHLCTAYSSNIGTHFLIDLYRQLVGFVNGALPKSDDLWHKFSRNKNILRCSFLRHHTLWFFFATCATRGNKYSVHCTCRRLCLRRVKRENDTDRRCQSLNFRERRRYSLFCWIFENNTLLIITSDQSYFLLYIGFEYLSSESTRKLGFSEGIPWVSSEKSVVTSRSKQGAVWKQHFIDWTGALINQRVLTGE